MSETYSSVRLRGLEGVARLDQSVDVQRPGEYPGPAPTREQEIFEAYQRGQKDAFRIMRNFAGEKLEDDDETKTR